MRNLPLKYNLLIFTEFPKQKLSGNFFILNFKMSDFQFFFKFTNTFLLLSNKKMGE